MNDFLSSWFQIGPIPTNALVGEYNITLVILSYIVAVLASYVALNIVGRLRAEQNTKAKLYWLAGGAFAMGAGIWSMHFIGMLAFILPMPMMYEFGWTSFSLLVAILASTFALYILQKKRFTTSHLIGCGLILGLAISTMHYTGMEGMKIHINIHYDPLLFLLSIAIGIFAAEAAIWLALRTNQKLGARQLPLQLMSALIMGLAICGLHYTGMTAAVFTPHAEHLIMPDQAINPNYLAFFIAGITILVASLALTASTYYKKMVLAVQNEKEFLNAMLDNLKDGIIACNEAGKITVLNQALQKNIPASMSKKTIADLFEQFTIFGPDEKPLDIHHFSLALNEEEAVHLDNLTLQFKSNVIHNVVIDGQKIINSDGKNLGIVIVVHDVTELKQTEKLKNEFVSIVSHELRTPLTSIRGSLGLLVSGMLGTFPEKAQKLLEIANNNCERLLWLINDILDIEKIEAGKMNFELKPYEVNALVRETIEANHMYANKYEVSLLFNPTPDPHYVQVDSGRFMQVLTNLISNACKFSPKGSEIKVNVEEKGNDIQISVIDQGTGIAEEFHDRIFQKFSQADSSNTRGKGGTGLGLNISKKIMEKMGGSLNFASLPNQGATFYFSLPITNSLLEEHIKTSPDDAKKLLLCEDDEDQAQYLQVLLESAGYIVHLAYTVAQAKVLLKQNKYQSLLLDLILPDQDGISFIRELRADPCTANLHIIVLSVIAQTGQKLLNGEAVSVVDWLDKPIELNKLLSSINKIKKEKSSSPNILHIEDNVETQHIVSTLLEQYASVSTANNLKGAQEMLNKKHYDLIILDLLLPDGNALEVLPLLARHMTPILVFSNMELNQDYSKFVSQALLKSNSSNDLLLKTIRNLL